MPKSAFLCTLTIILPALGAHGASATHYSCPNALVERASSLAPGPRKWISLCDGGLFGSAYKFHVSPSTIDSPFPASAPHSNPKKKTCVISLCLFSIIFDAFFPLWTQDFVSGLQMVLIFAVWPGYLAWDLGCSTTVELLAECD